MPYDGDVTIYTQPIAPAKPAEIIPEAARILIEAERIIRKQGWRRGAGETAHGPQCLLSAVAVAARGTPSYLSHAPRRPDRQAEWAAVTALTRAVDPLWTRGSPRLVYSHNDTTPWWRGRARVMETLRRAIEIAGGPPKAGGK